MTRPGKSSEFLLDCSNRFGPKPHELDPNPYTREAIAYFATSLNFDLGPRQAKSEVYDGSFREMCRSVYEHPMRAEVGWTDGNFAPTSFIADMQLAQMLDPELSASAQGRSLSA